MLRIASVALCLVITRASEAEEPAKPKPVIRVSKETTFLVEPLDADGYVNYVEAVDRILSKGATVENNFEVVVRKLLGPDAISPKIRAEYFKRLGIPVPPPTPVLLRTFSDFHKSTDQEKLAEALREESLIMSQPWSTKDHPLAEKWLQAMDPALDRLVAGSRRSRYYTPHVTRSGDHEIPSLLGTSGPIQDQRRLAYYLMSRAYARIGAGDLEGAWRDVQAIHRIARFCGQGILLFDRLVGSSIESYTTELEVAILRTGKLTAEQCQRFLIDLQSLPPLPTSIDAYKADERLPVLEWLQGFVRSGGKEWLGFSIDKWPNAPLAECDKVDWNTALELINVEFDTLAAAYRDSDPVTGREQHLAYARRVQEAVDHYKKPDSLNNLVLHGSPQERGRQFAKLLIGSIGAQLPLTQRVDVRLRAKVALTQIGYALELYRFKQGRYPQSLHQLAPDLLKTIPLDPHSGKLFIYRAGGRTGFIVYSVGQNRQDDFGRVHKTSEDPDYWDDIAVEGPPAK